MNRDEEYDYIMDSLRDGTMEDWERISMQVPDFPNGRDHHFDVEWIINAIYSGSFASVKWILSKKVNLHFITDDGYSVLHSCIDRRNGDKYEIMRLLIDNGADVNIGNTLPNMAENSWTPLHRAAAWNDLEAVKMLLENGADTSLRTIIDNYCDAEQEATSLGKKEAADLIRNYKLKKNGTIAIVSIGG
jgi:ankyrin repeat protein